jgi:prepilin-type N-terminal cleavage/methylation domain-containing protein
MIGRPKRQGFTLVELLVATALLSLLAINIWMLLGTYRRLFESGSARADQSRLGRALLEQMSDDLGSAIQDTNFDTIADKKQEKTKPTGLLGRIKARPEEDVESNLYRFGLFGTANSIRLDIIKITPEQAFSLYEQDQASDDFKESLDEPLPEVAELQTIDYRFTPIKKPDRDKKEDEDADEFSFEDSNGEQVYKPRPGLVRRELRFDRPTVTTGSQDDDSENSSSVAETEMDEENFEPLTPADTWIPEVTDMQLSYYDGKSWGNNWDSIKRKSLPAAIRIAVTFESFDPEEHRRAERAQYEAELSDNESTDFERDSKSLLTNEDELLPPPINRQDEEDDQAYQIPTRTYQIVVAMPVSPKFPGSRAAIATSSEIRSTIAEPREPQREPGLTRPRRAAKGNRPGLIKKPSSDRWIRSQPNE